MPADRPEMTPPLAWAVREEGRRVIIEVECRDAYQAIQLAEVVAKGVASGRLELEFEHAK